MKIFLLIFLFLTSLHSEDIIIVCENNYEYKISYFENDQKVSYKFNNSDWKKVKNFKLDKNTLEVFISNFKYQACADNNLPICKYSIIIKDLTKKRSSSSEVIINDCFIGTMGCNNYEKGLELNQSICKIN